MDKIEANKPWITVTEFVDKETGEIITRKNAEKNYNILSTTKKYEASKHYNVAKYIKLCGISPQLKLKI